MSLRHKRTGIGIHVLFHARRTWGALLQRARRDDGGANLVEMGLMIPVALLTLSGIIAVIVYLNNQLELENATSIAGEYLSLNRGTSLAADPCATFVGAFAQVSPAFDGTQLGYSILFSGSSTPYTGTTCKPAATYMTQNATATITVTYPCSLAVYGANLVPGCTLTYTIAEIIQ